MNREQRDLLIYAQGMLDGLIWCVPDDKVEGFSCALEKLEEVLKIEDSKDQLDLLKDAAMKIRGICDSHKCVDCPLHAGENCPFCNDMDDPVNPYLWNLNWKKEDNK